MVATTYLTFYMEFRTKKRVNYVSFPVSDMDFRTKKWIYYVSWPVSAVFCRRCCAAWQTTEWPEAGRCSRGYGVGEPLEWLAAQGSRIAPRRIAKMPVRLLKNRTCRFRNITTNLTNIFVFRIPHRSCAVDCLESTLRDPPS